MLFGSPEQHGREVEAVDSRYRSPGLLIFGASSAVLGFITITVIGLIEFMVKTRNSALHREYPSGNGYWPSTVSEMVHDQESPGGKLFYTFGLIAGVCIFQSQYPFHLRNVYTGNEKVWGTRVYWTTFRQICPSMGLWLLIGVNTYPTQIALDSPGYTKMFCVFLHLTGAGMMFVGYMVCELKCLHLKKYSSHSFIDIEPKELRFRTFLAWTILVGFIFFCFTQVLLNVAKKSNVCCPDVWKMKGSVVHNEHGHKMLLTETQLVNTASDMFLKIKVASFIFEDVAGVALVLSHLAIWYFSEERHVEYGNQRLKEVYKD
eukprot:CAMPEP_0204606834 /NCGR_PEP_ID=MMETSP0661-20131031/59333_1 /ASSEMBLY_ACC=CAM_ASM_000606 /TAXON_ID=109239 /ORGANISM="Alexandrium margalefi, Strain AMGDE01CS-322" /LENGTH=317 /DNA_ID=CAMNT_0051618193 /DNA_START=71 /DNA_END=1024 /DNA_ORIENTATION=+